MIKNKKRTWKRLKRAEAAERRPNERKASMATCAAKASINGAGQTRFPNRLRLIREVDGLSNSPEPPRRPPPPPSTSSGEEEEEDEEVDIYKWEGRRVCFFSVLFCVYMRERERVTEETENWRRQKTKREVRKGHKTKGTLKIVFVFEEIYIYTNKTQRLQILYLLFFFSL